MLILPSKTSSWTAGGGGGAVAVNHQDISTYLAPGGTGTDYTFTSTEINIGLDSEGALFIGVIFDFANSAPTDVTVGGVSAGTALASAGTTEHVAWYRMANPGDHPQTVVVQQTSGSRGGCIICAYRVSGAAATPGDTTAVASTGGDPLSLDVGTVADGAVLGIGLSRNLTSTFSAGLSNIVQVDDTASEVSSGYALTTTAETRTVSFGGGGFSYRYGATLGLDPA